MLVVGFFLVDSDAITVGAATAAALLFIRTFDTFNIVLGTIDEANRALAALARLVGVLGVPEPPPPTPHDGAHVSLRKIRHAYEGGPLVLHDIDLHIEPGERVAIVGVSGSGKTTLAKVVARFHEPDRGHGRDRRRRARHAGGARVRGHARGRSPARQARRARRARWSRRSAPSVRTGRAWTPWSASAAWSSRPRRPSSSRSPGCT